MDQEVLEHAELVEYVQRLQERRAELQDAAASAPSAASSSSSSSSSSAAAAEVAQLEEELAAAEAAVAAAAPLAAHHGARLKGLIDKQRRERGVLIQRLAYELKGTIGPAVEAPAAAPAGGDDGDAAAGSSRAASSGAGVAASSSSAPTTSLLFQMGYRVCDGCAAHHKRADGKACSECSRELCGRGGKGWAEPLGGPCIDVYRCCGCNSGQSAICHDCLSAGPTRTDVGWRCCALCDGWACTKDGCQNECRKCGLTPVCRACRGDHDKACRGGPASSAAADDSDG